MGKSDIVVLQRRHVIDILQALKFFKQHTNKGPVSIIDHRNVNDCIIAAIESALEGENTS